MAIPTVGSPTRRESLPSLALTKGSRALYVNPSVEQVLTPFGVRPAHQSHDVAAGMEIEGTRLAH